MCFVFFKLLWIWICHTWFFKCNLLIIYGLQTIASMVYLFYDGFLVAYQNLWWEDEVGNGEVIWGKNVEKEAYISEKRKHDSWHNIPLMWILLVSRLRTLYRFVISRISHKNTLRSSWGKLWTIFIKTGHLTEIQKFSNDHCWSQDKSKQENTDVCTKKKGLFKGEVRLS